MSWLDRLPAQPAVSVRFRQRFLMIGEVLGLLEPFLKGLNAEQGRLRVGTSPPWDIDLESPGGFTYRLRRDGLRVAFSYDNVVRDRSRAGIRNPANLPAVEPFQIIPFADLLKATLASVDDLLRALSAREAMVDRFGLEASIPMSRAQAPPGVGMFLRSLGWLPGYEPIRASCQIFSRVNQREGSDDRVHYNLQSSDDGDDLELLLDFQRHLEPAVRLRHPATAKDLAGFIGEAVAHFEIFGSGIDGGMVADLRPGSLTTERAAPSPARRDS